MPATETYSSRDVAADETQLGALDGRVRPGSVVTVADRPGRVTEYELIARPGPEDARQRVPVDSETGRALLGARPGEYVHVTLANGRQRRVRVMRVDSPPVETP